MLMICFASDFGMEQVRLWDVPTGKAVETLNPTKAVHAVGVAPGFGGPVAFGGAEGALRLWDPRAPKGEDLVRHTSHLPISPQAFKPA
jgi:WD40 repeat protein